MALSIKPRESCRWDAAALGEIMLRLDPGEGRIRTARVGLNFTERGYGLRGAIGCSDRGWSAASQLKPGDVNWKQLFEEEGVRWLHCGGIFAALSATAADLVIEAMEAARAAGTIISYDLNFRASLWKSQGGIDRAVAVNRRIASLVDVMIGNEEDFTAALGLSLIHISEPTRQAEISYA